MGEFQRHLNKYLRHGYRAGEQIGAAGRAIGFVMTTYRKLASSSIAAIERGLRLRLERLSQSANEQDENDFADDLTLDDLAEGGDEQDDLASSPTKATEFFSHEKEMLEELLANTRIVRNNDEKLRIFINQVVTPDRERRQKPSGLHRIPCDASLSERGARKALPRNQ